MTRRPRRLRARGWAWTYLALFGEGEVSDDPSADDAPEAGEHARTDAETGVRREQ